MGRPGIEPGATVHAVGLGLSHAAARRLGGVGDALVTSAINAPSWCTRRCSEGTRFSRRFWTSFWIQLRIVLTRRDSNPREGLLHEGFHAKRPRAGAGDTSHEGTRGGDASKIGIFQPRVDAAREASTNHRPGSHWTMDKAMDAIRAAPGGSFKEIIQGGSFEHIGKCAAVVPVRAGDVRVQGGDRRARVFPPHRGPRALRTSSVTVDGWFDDV